MLSSPSARRRGAIYAVLVAITLLLLAFSASEPLLELRRGVGFAVAPIQGALRDGTRQVTSIFAAIGEIERLRVLNAELSQRAQELELENRQLESIRRQNEQLAELLKVRASLGYNTVAAEVISRRLTTGERVVTLGRGAETGVREGDVVIAGGGALVGQVVAVGTGFSHVHLLNDSRFRVVGLDEETRSTGLVTGQLDRPLAMSNIPATEEISVGDSVITAGIDLGGGIRSPFPRGLLIGTVVDVQRPPAEVVQSALLVPAAPLERLEYVLVITDYTTGPTLEPGESPGNTPTEAPNRTLVPAP
ncbi:MAG TPA: rod shape-determining protein MreC [Candidatus Limnocylindrales bacterium]|nr:rod shape-determining protein MreC [Candidatus Limnocylindrales bacterium]